MYRTTRKGIVDPVARALLKRQIQATIANLLELDVREWYDPTPLPEFVFFQLDRSWVLDEKSLYLALFKQYSALLEATGPFERLDPHLRRVLAQDGMTHTDFIHFADIRIRWRLQQGAYDEVEQLLAQAWAAATTPELQARVANREGVYWKERNDYSKSLRFFQLTLEYTLTANHTTLKVIVYNNLGNWNFAQDLYEEALSYYKEALHHAMQLGNAHFIGAGAAGIAMTLEALERYQEAFDYIELAERYYQIARYRPGLARILLNRSYLDAQVKQFESAKHWGSEALMLARELGDSQREATALHNLGFVYAKIQDWDNALAFFGKALTRRLTLKQPLLVETTQKEIKKLQETIQQDLSLPVATRTLLLNKCSQILDT
jgi:tetratricopeptide (TPR) repeat protein